jgi:hypothetical protein
MLSACVQVTYDTCNCEDGGVGGEKLANGTCQFLPKRYHAILFLRHGHPGWYHLYGGRWP